MTNPKPALTSLSDHQLHQYTIRCASRQRGAKAASVAALAEVARRKLYLRYASSLALYAQRELGYSEASAYRHSQAAFLACEFPEVIEKLESGELSLDAVTQAARAFRERDRKAAEKLSPKVEQRTLQPSLGLLRIPSSAASERKMGYVGTPATADPSFASVGRANSPSSDSRPEKLSKQEKREVLHAIASQPRSVVQRKLGEVRANGQEDFEGRGGGRPVKARPHARLDSFDGNWSELRVYLSAEESAKLQHLRNLLSRAHPSLDLNAIFARLLEEALDRHDPVRQEERALRRRAKAARKNPVEMSARAPQLSLSSTQAVIEESSKHSSGEQRLPEDAAPSAEWKVEKPDFGSTGFRPKHDITGTQVLKNKAPFRSTALLHVKATRDLSMKTACDQPMKIADRKTPLNVPRPFPQSSPSPLPSRARPRRVPLSPILERKVRIRDENRCQYPIYDARTGAVRICGSERFTQIDHIHPVSQGGTNEITNLRVTCSSHNVHRMMLERRDR